MKLILLSIAPRYFDPTAVDVSWKIPPGHGHWFVFATPDGKPGASYLIMPSGIRALTLGKCIPVLRHVRVLSLLLGFFGDAMLELMPRRLRDPAFKSSMRWDQIESRYFDGLLLVGELWARGMCVYFESSVLQRITAQSSARKSRWPRPAMACRWPPKEQAHPLGVDVPNDRKTTTPPSALGNARGACSADSGRFWDLNHHRTDTEVVEKTGGQVHVRCSRRSRV